MAYMYSLFIGRLRTALYLLLFLPHKAGRLRRLSQSPIVIGGCGRSGTTLLLSLLSCHPEIVAIDDETGGLCPRPKKKAGRLNAPVRMWRVYKALNQISIEPRAQRWCEKTPRNVRNYAAILDYFGSSVRILNIVRDGRDVVTSFHPGNRNKYLTKEEWADDVEDGLRFEHHPQVLTLKYEELVADMQGTMRKVCEFTAMEYAPEFDGFPETAKIGQLRGHQRPVSGKVEQRWRKPENQKTTQAVMSDPRCCALLEHYGYPLV